ncbi:Vanadium nitrogenase [Rhodovastum atsumiense]|uniref:Vanadium nitrogenase n=1 Tax=Rhodovastum atsumiense TaxID=504468 RepID=A0A5M6IWA0_9PROT|nr:nitrogenase component 1 [Rhodovastum atsumiense]KAA5612606.1 vanadium nitrogenase [Rhodovastum atsumiense]CAH2601295.1 Vanadium nitrogenase [Rhodovastum atsumiense]
MAVSSERPGTGCALHGALLSAAAVPGVVPILHATAGCAVQAGHGGTAGAAGWSGGLGVPATNVFEKQVVFGATARLREQIKNAVKILDGQLYVVLSSCATEMIGDDIPAMAKEAREQGLPVIDVATAGFRGPAHEGYTLFLKGVLAQAGRLGAPGPRDPALVNLLGIVPGQDVFWEGELAEWSRLLAGIGLRANPLFGPDGGVDGLRDLPRAAISLVFSPWGLEVARGLEQSAGVPWLDAGGLPVGVEASAELLRALAARLGADAAPVEAVIAAERRREDHALLRLAEAWHRLELQREFALVAGSLQVPGLVRFLVGTLGWLPRTIVVTDALPEPARAALEATLAATTEGFEARVLFSDNAAEIADAVLAQGAEIVLGRAFERDVAERLGVPLVELAFPVADRLVLDSFYSGPRGARRLIEEIGRAALAGGRAPAEDTQPALPTPVVVPAQPIASSAPATAGRTAPLPAT